MGWLANYRFDPRLAFRVWQREVDVYRKIYRSTILGGLADPVVYLLAMGLGLGAYVSLQGTRWDGVPYIAFLAPGLVASSAATAATYEVTWNAFMRIHNDRVYAAMLTTPAQVEDVVAGELLWAATRSAIYAALMLAVLAAFGLCAALGPSSSPSSRPWAACSSRPSGSPTPPSCGTWTSSSSVTRSS